MKQKKTYSTAEIGEIYIDQNENIMHESQKVDYIYVY